MSALEPPDTTTASWQQVEDLLSSLHELARAPVEAGEFYQKMLEGCVNTLAAAGGAIWQFDGRGKWQPLVSINPDSVLHADAATKTEHLRILERTSEPRILISRNAADSATLVGSVSSPTSQCAAAIVELVVRSSASPEVQQGWQNFLAAVIHAAEEFHLRTELRALQSDHSSHGEVLSLLRRLHRGKTLTEVAYDLVNEGSRFLSADRVSILVQRGEHWKLLAANGVERLEDRTQAVKQLVTLAEITAHWHEPLDYADGDSVTELPPSVLAALEQYIDHSHARRLIAIPITFNYDEESRPASRPTAVLIAEGFQVTDALSREQVIELAQLCEPALQHAIDLDRWPLKTVIHWTNRVEQMWQRWGLRRRVLTAAIIAAVVSALVFVRTDFEIEAPATLMPQTVQDIFATASGTVRDIKVEHGQLVEKGDMLALLEDAQLDLETERVQGELATVRKRLEAIAVARADNRTREEISPDRLPLSAEAVQLELRQKSLVEQLGILNKRRDDLTLCSPFAGVVLTLDVQHALRGRPVERGQVLFTVADLNSGWQLDALVPQDRIGHVIAAEQQLEEPLSVRFRLAGDNEHTYYGTVREVAETAMLDPKQIADQLPEVRVEINVDEKSLPVARPDMQARVRINCGRRSLGYVWLHDAWDNIYSWLAF
jgi:multidrug efflux pump subunit AcrA (membrane-fusion protein)